MSLYNFFLENIIDNGIEAAKRDYNSPNDSQRREGSVAGFEACRYKTPQELILLFNESSLDVVEAHREQSDKYWFLTCFHSEVEWVCKNLAAVGFMEHIVPQTALPTINAFRILKSIEG